MLLMKNLLKTIQSVSIVCTYNAVMMSYSLYSYFSCFQLAQFLHSLVCLPFLLQLSIPGNAESVYISGLSMYGSWLDDSRSENPLTIMEDYLEQV